MYIYTNIYIWVMRTWSQTVMVSWCACWNVCDPINPFSLKWDKQQVLRGTLIGQGMNQHQQFRLVTSWSSHPHMAMWNDFMSMTSYFSKFFVPIPLPPYCIKWCWHLHASSDALSTLSNTGLLSCHFFRQCLWPMALLPVQPDLQTLFAPILHTQRELARTHEIMSSWWS